MASVCAIITLIVALAFMVYGFVLILRKKPKGMGDEPMIADQLRGFAFLIIAQLVFIIGMAICFNQELFGLGTQLLGAYR